jgi:flagellin-like protein
MAPLKYTITPKGGIERKMKILKSKKALSPVVASIILIAVTVAVSIAVAAWMGALTFSFMGTEQLTISKITWVKNANFTITVINSGTKDVTINQILVNYAGVASTSVKPTPPFLLKATGITNTTIAVTYAYSNGTNYDISVVTSSGYKFTNTFQGGTNSG